MFKGKVFAKKFPTHFAFPGGGVEKNESAHQAAVREITEETGSTVSALEHFTTIEWDWFPTWAKTPKQKDRYKRYRGERIHIFVGDVLSLGKPSSEEGDAWSGRVMHSISSVIQYLQSAKDHKNMDTYRVAQVCALKSLGMLAKDRRKRAL
jgi:hypothetical protein